MSEKIDFNGALKEWLDSESGERQPLTPSELMTWREGNMSEEERRELQRRLLHDRAGVEALLAMEEAATDEAALSSWKAFEKKLDAMEDDDCPDDILPFPGETGSAAGRAGGYPLVKWAAAVLLVATLLLGYKVDRLSRGLKPSLSPGVATAYVAPPTVSQRGEEGEEEESAGASDPLAFSQPRALLILNLDPRLGEHSLWQVTLLNPDGKPVFSGRSASSDGLIMLTLTRDIVSTSGRYTVEVAGVAEEATVGRTSVEIVRK